MKKLFLTLMLLLPLTAMAQPWTAPAPEDYPDRTPVFVQVKVNGELTTSGLTLAAFIGNECRAVTSAPMLEVTGAPSEYYALETMGAKEADASKSITFRAFYNGVEYSFTTASATFSADNSSFNEPSSALVLNLDAVTGISVTNPIKLSKKEAEFPFDADLSSYITLLYQLPTGGNYTPLGESKIESAVTYTWTTTATDILTVPATGNTITVKAAGTPTATLTVNIGGASFVRETSFDISYTHVPVTGISCNIEGGATDFYAFEDFSAFLMGKVTVTPGDASEKGYNVTADPTDGFDGTQFTKGGKFTVTIASNDNADIKTTVNVTSYVRPTSIVATAESITVGVNGDVYAAIANITNFTWPGDVVPQDEYAKKNVTYAFGAEGYVDATTHKALKVGTVNVTVTLPEGITTNPTGAPGAASFTIPVNIISQLSISAKADVAAFVKTGSPSYDSPATITVNNPGGEPFDKTKLSITFADRYTGFPYATQTGVTTIGKDNDGADLYGFSILPQFVGTGIAYTIYYNGTPVSGGTGTIAISRQQQLAEGWNWVSVTTVQDGGSTILNTFKQADIIEARSQTLLIYNDSKLGYFGNLINFTADGGTYKVKTKQGTSANWGSNSVIREGQAASTADIKKGYNWINNPYEFDIPGARIAEFLGGFAPAEGDIITTQDGFAQYDGTAWVVSDGFTLKEGKGLVYYSTADAAKAVTFAVGLMPTPSANAGVKGARHAPGKQTADLGEEIFQYDVHAFADNMAMVATIDGLDNPEDYTLGVFVNGECRGRGRVVKDDIMFVNAVGKAGEMMTFKLANNQTGEIIELDETMTYSLLKGSMKAPVVISGSAVTGIEKVQKTQDSQDEPVYDLSGRRVEKVQKGIYIRGGKKVLYK